MAGLHRHDLHLQVFLEPHPMSSEPTVRVVSTGTTTTFPDLGLELPAGVSTPIPSSALDRVLSEPSVSVATTEEA